MSPSLKSAGAGTHGQSATRGAWNLTAPRTGAILQIPEQRDRARSPANKATGQADARVQAIRDGGRDDPRHRTGGENQETTIQPQTTNRTSNHRSGNLGRGPGRLNLQSLSPDKYIHLIKFAPEPPWCGALAFHEWQNR